MLLNLRTRSTDALLGAVAKVLADEGIELISSTTFLEPLLAEEGVLTSRAPDADECLNIEYGLGVARALAALRHRPDGRRCGSGLRGSRGHGGHGRNH